ncbi:alpha/beta fold hydrolase [Solimicrobium silvestre]|uniref:Alpha/beta hydrolase fold n=1 Tax=Solimicrobium silvestre TaxID=2099400 RepID=A0A2S9H1D2_9BURK|nr:alpha/beta fold hydrolase [Solimicrobium silvestre]PRC93789.1 alpha/beta hydrolase fold [Solimicrobium silvestre]
MNTVMMWKRLGCMLFLWAAASCISAHASDLLKPCRVDGFAQQVQCGQIQRPLNPDEPNGKQISLHFIVLTAQDKSKAPDPIFLLAGGPGQSAINVASWMKAMFEKLQRRRDLVFVDQRGTGKSAPLICPESSDLKGIGEADHEVQEALKCKTQLEKLPYGDLRFFTTSIAMQDLDAVRAALNYPQINLIGISYGTRAALEYARQFPTKVRRSVLDGVVQPDQMLADDDLQKSLDNLFKDCAQDVRCQKAYSTLPQDWKKLLAGLPQKAQLTHPRLGTQISATITRDDVLGWVTAIIYSPVNSAGLPSAITQAGKGNFNPMLALSGTGNLPNPGSIAYGMHFSVVCAEEYEHQLQATKPSANNDFGDLHNQMYLKVCQQWPRGKVPEGFYTTPVSATPVLLLSGGIDPVTPPWHADRVAKALGPMARHIVLERSGHGMLQQTCLSDVATKFINAKTDQDAQNVDASCVKQIPRPSVWIAPVAPSNSTESAEPVKPSTKTTSSEAQP